MLKTDDPDGMWSLHEIHNLEECTPGSHTDPCDEDYKGDEDADHAEIEAMLYSQLYFEPHLTIHDTSLAASTEYDVAVEDHADHFSDGISTFAALVNFSGRSFMSPTTAELEETENRIHDGVKAEVPKLERTGKVELDLSKLTKGSPTAKNTGNLLGKTKTKNMTDVVVIMSDSSEANGDNQKCFATKKRKANVEGKSVPKRSAEKNNSLPVKKPRKLSDDIITVDSSSDTGSDSDCLFYKWSDSDDDVDINLHVNGLWRGFRDPSRQSSANLSAINLQNWDGDPPLTVQEVHSLLKGDSWKINDDDRYGLLRSYGKNKFFCRNCNERDHLARDCPKPKKVAKCATCGESGHIHWRCPNALCYNCDLPGHSSKMCLAPRKSNSVICNRCGFSGHIQSNCPELWRQYHVTTKPGPLQKSVQEKNKAAFCYNCGNKGHYGYECKKQKISDYLHPWSPFVTCYYTMYGQSRQSGSKHKNNQAQKGKTLKSRHQETVERKLKSITSLAGQGKKWKLKKKKADLVTKEYQKEKKKNNANLSSLPQFFKHHVEKVQPKQKQQKTNGKAKKRVSDEEIDDLLRNKKNREKKNIKNKVKGDFIQVNNNNNMNKTGRTKKSLPKCLSQMQKGLNNMLDIQKAKNDKSTKASKRCDNKNIHTIFDSPSLDTSLTRHSKKNVKDGRKIRINKKGFKMTIYT